MHDYEWQQDCDKGQKYLLFPYQQNPNKKNRRKQRSIGKTKRQCHRIDKKIEISERQIPI
jgi:hypothetical protein